MTAPLADYAEFHNNYCISYLGNDEKIIDALLKARDKVKEACPEVRVFLLVSGDLKGVDIIPRNGDGWYGQRMAYTREVTSLDDIGKILEEI